MKVSHVEIRNFRRLEDIQLSLETDHTLFVGPNNSGKTSAAAAFRLFFKRNDFTINDFTVACISDINKAGSDASISASTVPAIEMDIWFSIDPEKIEFGRVFSLLPNVSTDFDKVGIRLRYCVKDIALMRAEYLSTFPATEGKVQKSLCHFLSLRNMLSRHFGVRYFALEIGEKATQATEIEPDEGKRVLHSLIRVDFIDAQRNIHDEESGRQNRLSTAFSAYYKHNLAKPEDNEAANKVIDENNSRLTEHYEKHFKPLLKTISNLGVPSAHDRTLRLVSSLSAQEALQGSTELYYVDEALQHELPEAYNGLGFKNLVYMAIQISHYHAQWLSTEQNRELCQLIFVEEPEVHLHAQVQQIFIANIWKILQETAKNAGEESAAPQLVISTHSSHIVDTVEFDRIRYFCRCTMKSMKDTTNAVLNTTKVLNLKEFNPSGEKVFELSEKQKKELNVEGQAIWLAEQAENDRRETLSFLKKYLKLTHCDLFFADAAILIEGTAEKLLMSEMINKCAQGLQIRYLTVLEVGGAYAHKFSSLLAFLGIPYLVITDIDTVDSKDARQACPADTPDARTSNAALKAFLNKNSRDGLLALKSEEQIVADGSCFVAFQRPVSVNLGGTAYNMHGRTLEETFIYENLHLFRDRKINFVIDLSQLSADEIKKCTYEAIREKNFKKTEFALDIAGGLADWRVPAYIEEGLQWLSKRLAIPMLIGKETDANSKATA
jgi:putative ATP-dependent endonuclease of the OLD family